MAKSAPLARAGVGRWRLPRGRRARGIAEIVGTLMLILIVVAASVALAAFVATSEAAYLKEQAADHDRTLESLRVVSVSPYGFPNAQGDYVSMNFTIASTDPNSIDIEGILVDGDAVTNYTETANGAPPAYGTPFYYVLAPSGSVTIGLTFVPWLSETPLRTVNNSFANSGLVLSASAYLQIDLDTGLGNQFVFTALPPVAVVKVDILSLGSTYDTVLDGTSSFLPAGQNATIVTWAWSGTATETNCSSSPCTVTTETLEAGGWLPQDPTYGADVETETALGPGSGDVTYTYSLTLTVAATSGLEGTVTVLYAPGGGS